MSTTTAKDISIATTRKTRSGGGGGGGRHFFASATDAIPRTPPNRNLKAAGTSAMAAIKAVRGLRHTAVTEETSESDGGDDDVVMRDNDDDDDEEDDPFTSPPSTRSRTRPARMEYTPNQRSSGKKSDSSASGRRSSARIGALMARRLVDSSPTSAVSARRSTRQSITGRPSPATSSQITKSTPSKRSSPAKKSPLVKKPSPRTTTAQEYEVEEILDEAFDPQTLRQKYLVKWRGFSHAHNTWEPRANLAHCETLRLRFERARDMAARRKS